MLAGKKPLLWDDPEARLREFQEASATNLGQLDADFLRTCTSCAYGACATAFRLARLPTGRFAVPRAGWL